MGCSAARRTHRSRRGLVFSETIILLGKDVVTLDKQLEQPLRVGADEDVHRPLSQTVENLADIHRNIRRDVLVKVPALVVDRRSRNVVSFVEIEHAFFCEGGSGGRARLSDGLGHLVAQGFRGRLFAEVPLVVSSDARRDINADLAFPIVLHVDPVICRRRVEMICEPRRVDADVQTAADDHMPRLRLAWRDVGCVALQRCLA